MATYNKKVNLRYPQMPKKFFFIGFKGFKYMNICSFIHTLQAI